MAVDDRPEIGTRLYAWGKHWTVTAHEMKEGEPAVVLLMDGDATKRKRKHTRIWRLVERVALPSARKEVT